MNTLAPDTFDVSVARIDKAKAKLDVQELDFFYGKTHALKGVSMPIAEKAITALIGPSGCGKSTLLRTMNRMYALYPGQRATGKILLDGEDILAPRVNLSMLRARIGMVFQKPTPFPMSIYDNVAFGVRLYENLGKADMDARVEDSLRRAALWDEVKDKLPASGLGLSGGQQQRLCVARCIAVKPGDPAARRAHLGARPDLQRQTGGDRHPAEGRLHDRHRDPQSRPGRPRLQLHGLHVPGRAGRVRPHRRDVHQAGDQARQRLHHRPLRLGGATLSSEHTIRAYDEELEALTAELSRMGGLAEAEVAKSVRAISRRDVALAQSVITRDARLDEIEADIERRAIRLIALRQPVADDLRRTVAALKISMNLERCGDLAKNIAKRALVIAESDPITPLTRSIERMGELVTSRLKDVLDALAARDVDRARAVWQRDQEVDEHYDAIFRELLTYMMGDPRTIASCAHLLFVAKNLERIGDHATNIAEIITYEITGEQMTDQRPKLDAPPPPARR